MRKQNGCDWAFRRRFCWRSYRFLSTKQFLKSFLLFILHILLADKVVPFPGQNQSLLLEETSKAMEDVKQGKGKKANDSEELFTQLGM